MSRGLRLAYALRHRNYLVARLRAFAGSFTVILALAVVTVSIAGVSAWVSAQQGLVAWVAYPALFLGALTVLLGIMLALYAYAVGATKPRPKLLPGAIFSAVGVVGVYIGLGVALRFATNYQAVYGALAGVVIVMLVLYVSSYIILIGALANGQWVAARLDQKDSVSNIDSSRGEL